MKYGFAVCEQLLSSLLECIPFFHHFKDLCRRLAELSVQIIRLIYFLVETVATKAAPSPIALIPGALEDMKSAADRCFLFVFERIYRAPTLWQFLVHLPYNAIHRSTARALLVAIFNQAPNSTLDLFITRSATHLTHMHPCHCRVSRSRGRITEYRRLA
jgi:hypothetical protein